MRKRVLSLLLAICLVMGMLPPTAVAAVEGSSGDGTPAAATESVTLTMLGTAYTVAATETAYFTVSGGSTSANSTVNDVTADVTAGTVTEWNIKLDNRYEVAELTIQNTGLYSKNAGAAMEVAGNGKLKIVVAGTVDSTVYAGASHTLTLNMQGGTTITSTDDRKLNVRCNSSSAYEAINSNYALRLENANIYAYKKMNNANAQPHGAIFVNDADLYITNSKVDVVADQYEASGIYVEGKITVTDGSVVTVDKVANNTTTTTRGNVFGVYAKDGIQFGGGQLLIKDNSAYMRATTYADQKRFPGYVNDLESYSILLMEMPDITTLVDENEYTVAIEVGNAYDGSDAAAVTAEELTDAGAAIREYRYISFTLNCSNHQYDNDADADCNKCGATRDLPKDITVVLANTVTWNATANQVYYATTNANGVVSDLGALTAEPAEWNIKLDNTKLEAAELTFKGAYIKTTGSNMAMTAAGTGALKIIAESESTLETGAYNVLSLAMDGGTTVTSVNNSKLSVFTTSTSGYTPLTVSAGSLTLQNANLYLSAKNRNDTWAINALDAAGKAVVIDGGTLEIEALNIGTNAISAGSLTIRNYAVVNAHHRVWDPGHYADDGYDGINPNALAAMRMYGVKVTGDFVIDNATLIVNDKDAGQYKGSWIYAVNKMPSGMANVEAKYSETDDGANLQELNPADHSELVEYPYVSFKLICTQHEYTDGTDATCNKCGDVRELPKPMTVVFEFDDGTALQNIVWNVAPYEIYYATTDANGIVTSLGTTAPADGNWNIMLDNSDINEAVLTLKGAKITRTLRPADSVAGFGAGERGNVTVKGTGALRVVIAEDSTVTYNQAYFGIATYMTGGTTYESENEAKLTVTAGHSSALQAIGEFTGSMTFSDAYINAYVARSSTSNAQPSLSAKGDFTIDDGKVILQIDNYATNGIVADGNLTIKNTAMVTVFADSDGGNNEYSFKTYAVNAGGNFIIDSASLTLYDQTNRIDYMVNKMPTLVNTTATYSEVASGENPQELKPTDTSAPVSYRYVKFAINCTNHVYSGGETDPECDRCGYLRPVPMDITVVFGNYVKNLADKEVVWNAAPGSIYYATTDASGVITDLGALTTEPNDWNIKLDNTKATAELTLRNATIVKETEQGISKTHDGILANGNGALKIIIEGNSTVKTGRNNGISTNMIGGTTYTSVDGGKLEVLQIGTAGATAITNKAGALTFDHANIYATHAKNNSTWPDPVISATGAVNVIGGKLEVAAKNSSETYPAQGVHGIVAGGALTISDYAVVYVRHLNIGPDNFTGVTARPGSENYRYGVKASSITVNDASLYIIDNAEDMYEYAINKMPSLSAGVSAYYSTDITGANEQALTVTDPNAPIEYAYVAFKFACAQHEYDNATDPDCNKCGEVRVVPRTLTVRVTTGKDGVNVLDLTRTILANEIYYGVADEAGNITFFDKAETAPADWDFMVDNTQPTALVIFDDAYLFQDGEVKIGGEIVGLMNFSGEGSLKIITRSDSTLQTGYGWLIHTAMAGGTTYASENEALLTMTQAGTGGWYNIYESVGNLTFEDACIYGTNKRQGSWSYHMITGAGDISISGGQIIMDATNFAVEGLYAKGNLTISDLAKVTLLHSTKWSSGAFDASELRPRHGVEVDGTFLITDATLKIQDKSGQWEVTANKMPSLLGVNAKYSESGAGTDLQVLNPADPAAKITYDYVEFVVECTNHVYDNDTDPDCNRCGTVRSIARPMTVIFGNYVKDKVDQEIVWNVGVNQVYYAKTDASGVITDLGALSSAPAEWNIRLDNSKPTAELTLKNATLTKETENGYSKTHNTINITGEGALKIIIDGDSTVTSGYNTPIVTAMAGGTTYTSLNNSQLKAIQNGTSGIYSIIEKVGSLTFENANIYTYNKRQGSWSYHMVSGAADVTISGGTMLLEATSCCVEGIYAGGNLTLDNLAKVTVIHSQAIANTFTATELRPRHGVEAGGDITITDASLRIQDKTGMWERAINKMPTLSGVKAEYSESADGSNPQALYPADPAAYIEQPYVGFIINCPSHVYDNDKDPECNRCGATRDVPYDVTIRVVTDDGTAVKTLTGENDRKVTVAVGEVYYAVANAKGLVTKFEKMSSEPAEWVFKLDNTKTIAELVFNGGLLTKAGTYRDPADGTTILDVLNISGQGKLNIITKGETTITSHYGNVINTAMVGGTTYSSENGAKLTLNQSGTSGLATIAETAGVLNFKDAVIHATNKRQGSYKNPIVSAKFDMNVSGGSLKLEAVNCSTDGIVVGGSLTLSDYASVRMLNEKTNVSDYTGKQGDRHAVKVTGDFIINNASLRISDALGHWDVAVNKSPKLVGVSAKYSESAEGTNLQALNPADPKASIEYPFVAYIVNCAEHVYDSAVDAECNNCGEIRAVPYDINIIFQYGTVELETIVWQAKVGEIYYATTSAGGMITDLGALTTEPSKWNIKLDNTGPEAILTFREANITRKLRPGSTVEVLGFKAGSLGTITIKGEGALRVVTEKASTITTDEAYGSIYSAMDGGLTFESKNNAKLTLTGKSSATCGGINESAGNLNFENANISIKCQKTSTSWANVITVSTPRNMTVSGGKVEIIAAAYANNGLQVKGNLTVKDNGILIVTTSNKPAGGTCKQTPYGVTVNGDITVDNATFMIKNYGKFWSHLLNKMPTLVNAEAYSSATSNKESKLVAFSKDAGSDLTELEDIFLYFSNAKPGTLDDSSMEEEEEDDDDFVFEDFDNPFTGDSVNVTLLFTLVLCSAAALVVLVSKKKSFRE